MTTNLTTNNKMTRHEYTEDEITPVLAFRKEGYGNTEAAEKAIDLVSMPGTSEHQLGIAVDINAENGTEKNEAYKWLSENSYRFGFIVRYPSGKSHITGISYEPWHFRYVGKSHARNMYESGQCLEEYLQQFQHVSDAECKALRLFFTNKLRMIKLFC